MLLLFIVFVKICCAAEKLISPDVTEDYRRHWLRRQWPSIIAKGQEQLIPLAHFLPSRRAKLPDAVKDCNRSSSHPYSVSTVALINSFLYWAEVLTSKKDVKTFMHVFLNTFSQNIRVRFQFSKDVVGSDMLPGSRNIDKKEFVKLEHVAVNNGLVLLDEIKGKNMCKKEVLAG